MNESLNTNQRRQVVPAPWGVYYTTTKEEHPVYHLYSNCSEGEKIEDKNKATALKDHQLCEVCGKMNPKP